MSNLWRAASPPPSSSPTGSAAPAIGRTRRIGTSARCRTTAAATPSRAVIDLAGSDPAVTIDQGITLSGLTHSEVLHIAAGVTNLSTLLANAGAIDVTGSATLNLTGAFTAPAFGSLSANGGSIKLSATLDLAGGNMQIAGTNGWQLDGGTNSTKRFAPSLSFS